MWDMIKYPYLNKRPFLTAFKTTTWKCQDQLSKIAHFQGEETVPGERRAESGERRAESGERRAESGERRAESGERRAETGHRTPDNGHRTPDTGHRTPDNGHRTPDTGHRTPDNGHRTPDNGQRTPDTGYLENRDRPNIFSTIQTIRLIIASTWRQSSGEFNSAEIFRFGQHFGGSPFSRSRKRRPPKYSRRFRQFAS